MKFNISVVFKDKYIDNNGYCINRIETLKNVDSYNICDTLIVIEGKTYCEMKYVQEIFIYNAR